MDYWEKAQHLFEHADKGAWLNTLPEAVLNDLPLIALGSDYVIRQMIKDPDGFTTLAHSQELFAPKLDKPSIFDFASSLGCRITQADETAFNSALRRYRNLMYVKIIWRDLLQRDDLWQTIARLSDLADELILACCQYHHHQLCKRFGEPVSTDGVPQKMVVLAMGKLGAQELNLSSDVDLIFCYPSSGQTQVVGDQRSISNQEFFVKLGQKIIKSLSAPTFDGFVFRVDMRLRPFGQSGALALNFNAMETYYQDHGRPWERYAMIKARPLSMDVAAGEEIISRLRPFVYRRYIDFGAIEELRQMKSLINQQVQRQGQEANIKIGPGGIREVEFVAQAFQLIRGGTMREFQQRELKQILYLLGVCGFLPDHAVTELLEAYEFLRISEHRLQAVNDQQTHRLPDAPEPRARLAKSMGFESWPDYLQKLDYHRGCVRKHFDDMVRHGKSKGADQATDLADEVFFEWWLDDADDIFEEPVFSHLSQEQVQACQQCVKVFRQNVDKYRLSSKSTDRLDRLMPTLLKACIQLEQAQVVLNRVLDIITTILRRSVYITLLLEQPNALDRLVNLCMASPWLAEYLMKFPALIDELLYIPTFPYAPTRSDLEFALTEQLMRVDQKDLESQMEILRQFKNAHIFHAAVAEIQLEMPVEEVSQYLAAVAQVVLKAAFEIACNQVSHRRGDTQFELIELARKHFVIVALGKMGSLEMSYGSDLDLIFLYDKEAAVVDSPDNGVEVSIFFTRLTQRLMHILSTRTYSGRLYEVDPRLRPFGGDGLLVNTFDALSEYLKKEAWTWEHQALVRARTVVGSHQLGQRFAQLRSELLCQKRVIEDLSADVCQMREKMIENFSSHDPKIFNLKQDAGGIVDIEFLTQFAVLGWANEYIEFTYSTQVTHILHTLGLLGILNAEDADQLIDVYHQYRARIHRLVLMNSKSVVDASEFETHRALVRRVWQQFVER